jgi:predicted TIM-barrel fold metal-dependent hydrolase
MDVGAALAIERVPQARGGAGYSLQGASDDRISTVDEHAGRAQMSDGAETVGGGHPRYRGPVIDAHCHYDETTRAHAAATSALGGLSASIHLWDVQWPPTPPLTEAGTWAALEPALLRCHVPDLSVIGAPAYEEALELGVRDALAAGNVGIKVWKNVGLGICDVDGSRLTVDDPRLGALWHSAGEAGLPIAIHVGDPPAFFAPLTDDNPRIEELRIHPDWWWGGGEHPTLEQIHEQLERVVAAHPETTFIGLHFGCFMRWADVDRMLRSYPNYRVDTAAAIADMGAADSWEDVRAIILEHPERVIFGTDLIRTETYEMPQLAGDRWALSEFFASHWRFFETARPELAHPLPDQGDWTVHGIDLPDDVLARLYHANAEATFRLPATYATTRLA